MPVEIALATVGAGKTQYARTRIDAVVATKPFAHVWVLLATERQVRHFRNQLRLRQPLTPTYVNVHFFTVYDLYPWILQAARRPFRELSDAARVRLLRVLIDEMAEQHTLDVFEAIGDRPGFVEIVGSFIYELKSALVDETQFQEQVARVLGGRPRDAAIAQLYAHYQARLRQHHVVDREGMGWLALDALRDDAPLVDIDLLVVDGYDQLRPLLLQVIAQLARLSRDTLITLTDVPNRTETVGRRFARAYTELLDTFKTIGLDVSTQHLSRFVENRHPDLQTLSDNAFLLDTVTPATLQSGVRILQAPDMVQEIVGVDDKRPPALCFLGAPDVMEESRAVMREVKRLLLTHAPDGLSVHQPDDVVLVLRDYETYRHHLQVAATMYDVPILMHAGQPLAEVPVIDVLFKLLGLHDSNEVAADFTRDALLDVLRSPYVVFDGLDEAAVDLLDRVSSEWLILSGRDAWLSAIKQSVHPRSVQDGDETITYAPLLQTEVAERLHDALVRFFDAVTPPPHASMADYVAWLEQRLGYDATDPDEEDDGETVSGSWGVVDHVRAMPPDLRARDVRALNEFKRVMRGLLSSSSLLATLESVADTLTWAEFWADLQLSVQYAKLELNTSRSGRVLVTTANNARGLPHRHVFILGLSESLFPMKLPEDPLYLDTERRHLRDAGMLLETAQTLSTDEGLFYEAMSLAQQTLTLSRPMTRNGTLWIESHLWRAVAAVFPNVSEQLATMKSRAGTAPTIDHAATASEVAVALAERYTAHGPDDSSLRVQNWLLAHHRRLWANVLLGQRVEYERMTSTLFTSHTGRITSDFLLAKLQAQLGPDHIWSASQLNDYGICPFRFFAGRVLRLQAQDEPAIGLDARQLGIIYHRILERTYQQLADSRIAIESENLPLARETLQAVAVEVFRTAPMLFGFRPSPVWTQEQAQIFGRLADFLDFDFTALNDQLDKKGFAVSTRYPYRMELSFGGEGRTAYLTLGADMASVQVRGYVDRVDIMDGQLIVFDYKTGSTAIHPDELTEGRNFQIMLYTATMESLVRVGQLDGVTGVAGGAFLHLHATKPNDRVSGPLVYADSQDVIAAARETIGAYVYSAQNGHFFVAPTKPDGGRCARYCDFSRLCRLYRLPKREKVLS